MRWEMGLFKANMERNWSGHYSGFACKSDYKGIVQ